MGSILKSFFIYSVLAMLLIGVQTHFSNTESFLNEFYQHHSKAKDFDRDGDCETTASPDIELLKVSQFMMLPTVKVQTPQIIYTSAIVHPQFAPIIHPHSDYILSIFRPPIHA